MEKKFVSDEFGMVFGTVVGLAATIGVAWRVGRFFKARITGYRKCGKLLTMVKGKEIGKN